MVNLAHPNSAKELIRELVRLNSDLWRVSEKIVAVRKALLKFVEKLTSTPEGAAQGLPACSPDLALMRAEARAGVASLKIDRHADGSADVSVNGRRPLRLRPQLAALLTIIAGAGGKVDDHLVGWKTMAEIAAALSINKRGRAVSPGDVPKIVLRLREAFRSKGENWLLVQSRKATGEYRFAVRGDPR